MINPNTLKPFGKFCVTLGMIPSSYKTSLTYEEQLLWFCNYLETKVIPAINNNAEALEEVQALYEEMRQFVVDYFSKLDVQDEIDNKLDEMAQDGTLAQIINQEIFNNLNTSVENLNNKIFGNVPKVHFINRNGQFGDCSVIELLNNNIIIDLGIVDGLDSLIAYLINNNITKFKYLMISHWDSDHSSTFDGFKRLIENSNLDFSECTFILPPICDWTNTTGLESQELRCNQITSYLTANNYNILYPEENQVIELDNNNFIKFYNYNPNFIAQYENIMLDDANNPIDYTQINNICGVMEFNTYGKSFLFTGDIMQPAENNIASELPQIDVLKVSHHGLNRYTSQNFMRKINNKIGIIMNTSATLPNRPYFQFYCNNKGKLFTTNESGNIIISIDEYGNLINNSIYGTYNPNNIIVIEKNSDLNTFIKSGNYIANNNDFINTILNLPPNYVTLFSLNVEAITTNSIYQTLKTLNVNPVVWIRKTTDGGINWSAWQKININNFSYIRAGLTNYHDISSADFEKLQINSIFSENNTSNSLNLNNNNIVIGKGVSQIEASCNIAFGGLTAGDRIMCAIYKNNTAFVRIDKNCAGEYDGINISGQIIDVNENDTISVYVRNLNSRGRIYEHEYESNVIVKTLA